MGEDRNYACPPLAGTLSEKNMEQKVTKENESRARKASRRGEDRRRVTTNGHEFTRME